MLAFLLESSEILRASRSFLIVFAGFLLFLAHYLMFVVKKPVLFTGNPDFRHFLEKHVPTHKESYRPPIFLQSGILQTVFSVPFRPNLSKKLNMQREIFKFSDGGEAALDFALPPAWESQDFDQDPNPLVVLILPASFCTSKVTIVSSLTNTVVRCGCTAVVLNYRGYSGVKFSSPKFNTFADCDDVQEVIPYIKKKFGCRLMVIGQSAGGRNEERNYYYPSMVLAKYLREHPKEAKEFLTTSMMISMGWDMNRGYNNLNPPHYLNKFVIHRQHLSWMKQNAAKYSKQMGEKAWKPTVDFDKAMKAKTIYDFDQLLLVPQFEYESVKQYWQDASSRGNVLKFSIPVFCLNAQDDPATPGKLLPYDEAEDSNSKLALLVTSKGGHNGFLEGFCRKSEHFVERLVREYVTAVKNYGYELPKWTDFPK